LMSSSSKSDSRSSSSSSASSDDYKRNRAKANTNQEQKPAQKKGPFIALLSRLTKNVTISHLQEIVGYFVKPKKIEFVPNERINAREKKSIR